ncbi:MAG: AraC family ligand binding domain-containing protein [Caulobacterales bacterium]|nr:AraC family ligand binding domain-containing protein [Caulobacterales bacterium]
MSRSQVAALAALSALLAALFAGRAAQAQDAGGAHYLSAQEITARLAKPVDGTVNFALPTGPGVTVLAARRDTAGAVEVHKVLHDEFIVQSGHATVTVGGQLTGAREAWPGEWRGGAIAGGARFDLGPGDTLWIPAGQPHQVTPTGGAPFVYIAVKFPAQP